MTLTQGRYILCFRSLNTDGIRFTFERRYKIIEATHFTVTIQDDMKRKIMLSRKIMDDRYYGNNFNTSAPLTDRP